MLSSTTEHQIICLYKSLYDDANDIEKCVELLLTMVRLQINPAPPILELITVLKREKPTLFAHVRKRMLYHRQLSRIFDLNADYEQSKRRLNLS